MTEYRHPSPIELPRKPATFEQARKIVPQPALHRQNVMLYNALVSAFRRRDIVTPPVGRNMGVIDIACGRGGAIHAISAYFSGETLDKVGMRTNYIGIDTNAGDIADAQRMLTEDGNDHGLIPFRMKYDLYPYHQPNAQFMVGDATDISSLSIATPLDIGIMRHPDIENRNKVFSDILHAWVQHVPTLVVTSGYPSEYQAVLKALGEHVVLHGTPQLPPKDERPMDQNIQDTYIVIAKPALATNPPKILKSGRIQNP